eukprot:gene15-605_t
MDEDATDEKLASCQVKPPNIVIISQKQDNFSKWKLILERLLSQHTYVIYNLERKELLKTYWLDNIELVLVDYVTNLEEKESQNLNNFLRKGGSCLAHCCFFPCKDHVIEYSSVLSKHECSFPIDRRFSTFDGLVNSGLMDYCGMPLHDTFCCTSAEQKSVLAAKKFGTGHLVVSALDILATLELNGQESLSDVSQSNVLSLLSIVLQNLGLSCRKDEIFEPVQLTPGYLFGLSQNVGNFISSNQPKLNKPQQMDQHFTCQLFFSNNHEIESSLHTDDNYFPILLCEKDATCDVVNNFFNIQTFWKHLDTKKLGRLAIYSKTVTSTQFLLERITSSFSSCDGLTVIAGRQLKGKGRGGNKWLSPDGCMMFSLAMHVNISSAIGKRLPFLQHIVAVAVVKAIREIYGYEELKIGIKWPNDIYFGHSSKIGGLIVSSSVCGGEFKTIIGVGLNVANKKPTVCLNSIIDKHNSEHASYLQHISIEEVIGRTLTNIEVLQDIFERSGHATFSNIYYKYWLHGSQQIRLGDDDGEQVIIKGLDDNGFLLVEGENRGLISVQPDGNSFDMMKGLIKLKTSY